MICSGSAFGQFTKPNYTTNPYILPPFGSKYMVGGYDTSCSCYRDTVGFFTQVDSCTLWTSLQRLYFRTIPYFKGGFRGIGDVSFLNTDTLLRLESSSSLLGIPITGFRGILNDSTESFCGIVKLPGQGVVPMVGMFQLDSLLPRDFNFVSAAYITPLPEGLVMHTNGIDSLRYTSISNQWLQASTGIGWESHTHYEWDQLYIGRIKFNSYGEIFKNQLFINDTSFSFRYKPDSATNEHAIFEINNKDSSSYFAGDVDIHGGLTVAGNFEYEMPRFYGYYSDNTGFAVPIVVANKFTALDSTIGHMTYPQVTGFSQSNDTLTYTGTKSAHIWFMIACSGHGANGTDWDLQLFNITDNAEVPNNDLRTTTGSTNRIGGSFPCYDAKADPGDKYLIRIKNLSGTDDFTVLRLMWWGEVKHFE